MESRILALTMLALVFLTACPEPPSGDGPGNGPVEPDPILVEVHATVNEHGHIEIHKEPHETAIVGPGQRVKWACVCGDGLEFTIADLRPMFDIDHLIKLYMEAQDEATGGEGAAEAEDPTKVLERLAPAFFMAPRAHYQAQENGTGPPDVTRGWSSGVGENEFTDGTFLSPRVPTGIGHILWKFTWRVRRQGDPGSVVEWDPHIETHPGISGF